MDKDPLVFIEHILESIVILEQYTGGKTKNDFRNSVDLQDKVIRRLEIIGEAVRNLSAILRTNYPDIPWKQIAGMRDKLIHEYFGIDLSITWDAVIQDVPKLKRQILAIKKDLEK